MDLKKIEQLVKIVENSSMLEFSIKDGKTDISMSRKGSINQPIETVKVTSDVPTKQEDIVEETYINSPIVGTFYSASAPEEKPFVSVGDIVKAGQTLCILETMKLMNEIDCDFDCEIEAVLVSNEQKVEYGQPLFRVNKL